MYILAISPGPHEIRTHVHLTVIGRLEGQQLAAVPADEAPTLFPPFGKVRLERVYGIPAAGSPGIWKVGRNEHARDGQAELVVVEKRLAWTPTEIVRVPAASTDASKLRKCLIDGLALGFKPHLPVLVHTEDDMLLGPITGEVVETRGGSLLVQPEQFNEPLPAWQSAERVASITLSHDGKVRVFTREPNVPPPDTYCDVARLPEALRAVASALGDASDAWPTADLVSRVARCLRDPDLPSKYAVRAERILHALDRIAASRESLDTLMDLMQHHPTVQLELEAARAAARAQERERARQLEAATQERITALEAERTRLEQELDGKRESIAQADADLAEREAAFGGRLKARLDALVADPTELLASVAFLRPFLTPPPGLPSPTASPLGHTAGAVGAPPATGPRPPVALSARPLPPAVARPSVGAPSDLPTMRDVLATELRVVGLAKPSAKQLAADVLAAMLSEQMVMLRGSIAPLVAHACARAISGERARVVRVPLGLAGDDEIRTCVEAMQEAGGEAQGGPPVLVVEGVNRAALDGCGGCMRELVAAGVLDVPRDRGPLILIATLDQGPATLPPSASLLDLGPLFDLDLLTLSTRGEDAGPLPAPADANQWVAWMEATLKANPSMDVVEAVQRLQGAPSVLWQRAVTLAAYALAALGCDAGQQVDSLLYGWGLPRATAAGVPAAQVLGTLRSVLAEIPEGTGRARHLLQPLRAEVGTDDAGARNGQRAYA